MLPLLFSFLGGGLAKAGVLGAAGSFLANPLVASAIGSGIGTLAETGDPKKALMGGLGSFAGGQLLGGLMGGAGGQAGQLARPLPGQSVVGQGAGAMTAGTPLFAQPGMAGQALMPPAAAPQSGLSGMLGGRAGDVVSAGMDFAQSGAGIGSALGGMLPGMMPDRSRGTGAGVPDISQQRPMQRQVQVPGEGFRPGVDPEFDYGLSDPYTTDFTQRYAPQRRAVGGVVQNPYAEQYAAQRATQLQPLQSADGPMRMAGGGMITQRIDPHYGPIRLQAGGIAEVGAMPQEAMPQGAMPNEREVISGAIAAIKGQIEQPEIALGMFLQMFGEEALRDLIDRVQSGEFDETVENGEGQLRGPGDGMNDMIPATIDGEQDVLLSDGEYIVPADVVSGLGNGSTDAGAKALDEMADRIRTARTGTAQQAPQIAQQQMVPA